MPAAERRALVRLAFPADFPGRGIERVHHVAKLTALFAGLDVTRGYALDDLFVRQTLLGKLRREVVAEDPGRRRLVGAWADRRRHEHLIFPGDGRRPPAAGDVNAPCNIRRRRPRERMLGVVQHACTRGSAKLRPRRISGHSRIHGDANGENRKRDRQEEAHGAMLTRGSGPIWTVVPRSRPSITRTRRTTRIEHNLRIPSPPGPAKAEPVKVELDMRHNVLALSALSLGFIAVAASLAPAPVTAAGQSPKPRLMTVKDTQNFVNVGSPAISPDDKWVLYTQAVRDWNDAQLRTRTHIWRVKIDGTGARQLTFGDANTTSPAWFPDGSKIAFLSSRPTGAATAQRANLAARPPKAKAPATRCSSCTPTAAKRGPPRSTKAACRASRSRRTARSCCSSRRIR